MPAPGCGRTTEDYPMEHYLKVAVTTMIVMAIVFYVPPLRKIITGM